jgi:hypothetical protein
VNRRHEGIVQEDFVRVIMVCHLLQHPAVCQAIVSSHGRVTAHDGRSCTCTILPRPSVSVKATNRVQTVAEQGPKLFEAEFKGRRRRSELAPAEEAQAGPMFPCRKSQRRADLSGELPN